jgi:hypothetical protein
VYERLHAIAFHVRIRIDASDDDDAVVPELSAFYTLSRSYNTAHVRAEEALLSHHVPDDDTITMTTIARLGAG